MPAPNQTAPKGSSAKKDSIRPNKSKVDKSKYIVINLDRQVLMLYQSKKQVKKFDCVSGDSRHPTPEGIFIIQRKKHPCMSNEYKVPMDYALFFTGRGHAIHQGYVVGACSLLKTVGFDSIGSHGCVRLSEADAATVFNWAEVGTTVKIHRKLP